MDAILANAFLAIQERIRVMVPEIKFIDEDLDQLEYKKADGRPAVILPCALISFINITYEDCGEGVQTGSGIAQIRLGIEPITQATQYFTESKKEHALLYYNIEHRVNLALHRFACQYFSALSRSYVTTEKGREDNLRVRPLQYRINFMDYTGIAVPEQTIPAPDFKIEI